MTNSPSFGGWPSANMAPLVRQASVAGGYESLRGSRSLLLPFADLVFWPRFPYPLHGRASWLPASRLWKESSVGWSALPGVTDM